ncbi:hypothetical protein MH928_11115 [Flavobacterium sp. WW92]|nr:MULTISPECIES: hypothetical protein [Flavobacterium]WDO11879.1 hypothetical protein MH928_11115 [Flavobacterium sp. WW92]
MKKDILEEYKKAIKAKYEEEKNGMYSSFLINPSRGQLKDLCWEIFKNNSDINDLKSFSIFLGFDFSPTALGGNKLNKVKDKFRPIETFFKGETDLAKIDAADMAAILVDFKQRPLSKYSRSYNDGKRTEDSKVKKKAHIELQNEPIEIIDDVIMPNYLIDSNNNLGHNHSSGFLIRKKWSVYFVLAIFIIGGIFMMSQQEEKDCMEWRGDHYEAVDCSSESFGIVNTKIPMDPQQFKLRKLKPLEAKRIHYSKRKPGIWYEKTNGDVEFFNGPGYHPENHEYLKVATDLIINKYTE